MGHTEMSDSQIENGSFFGEPLGTLPAHLNHALRNMCAQLKGHHQNATGRGRILTKCTKCTLQGRWTLPSGIFWGIRWGQCRIRHCRLNLKVGHFKGKTHGKNRKRQCINNIIYTNWHYFAEQELMFQTWINIEAKNPLAELGAKEPVCTKALTKSALGGALLCR